MKSWLNDSVVWFASVFITLFAIFIFVMVPMEKGKIPEDGVTRIYYIDNISAAHQELVRRFNEAYKNKIEVVTVHLPFSKFSTNERKELLARALRSRTDRIDVFAVDLIWVPRFARWCEPLGMHFRKTLLEQIDENALTSCYFNNQLVASPLYIDIGLLYYRDDLLQSFPDYTILKQKLEQSVSWSEFIRLGKRYKGSGTPYYLFSADSYEGLICSFFEILDTRRSTEIFSRDTVDLRNADSKRALQMMVDFVRRHKFTPSVVTEFDEFQCSLYAMEEDALFFRGWPGFQRHYKDVIQDSVKLNALHVAAIPHTEGDDHSAVYGGWNLMISKFSDNRAEALEFLKFMLRPESQKVLHEIGGYIPVNKEVFRDREFMQKNRELMYFQKILSQGKHRPYREDYTKISDIMSHYLRLAIKGEMSVDEALTAATENINSDQIFIK